MSATANPAMMIKGARASMLMGYAAAPAPMCITKGLCMEVNSEGYDEDQAWIGEVDSFEEFVDRVRFSGMSDGVYTLVNNKYTTGIVIKRDDWNDDRVGGLGIRARQVGAAYQAYKDYLITEAVIDGVSNGAGTVAAGAHFATNHPVRNQESAVGDNLLTGSGTSVSNIQTDISAAVAALMKIQGEDGLLVGGGLRFGVMTTAHLLGATLDAVHGGIISQTSNVRYENMQFDVWANPYLDISANGSADEDDFYVYRSDSPIAPFLYQTREDLSVEAQDSAESDAFFEREEIRIKARFRGVPGYGRWQNVVKINNS